MFFLHPFYLWALLGLAVPIAIHLWSKKEGKTIKVGSIKLLQQSHPKKASTLKINEWLLLLLRMLLIVILTLILAGPQFKNKDDVIPITYLIEPSLLSYAEIKSLTDTLERGPALRLLQHGFPELEEERIQDTVFEPPYYWQLATEMEELPTDSIVVYTNAFVAGVKGMRPEVSKKISWFVIDPGKPEKVAVEAVEKENDIELISVVSDHDRLSFEKEQISVQSGRIDINPQNDSIVVSTEAKEVRVPLKTVDSLSILLVYNDSLATEKRYIESSFNAISKFLDRPISVVSMQQSGSLPEGNFHSLVWLSGEPVPETSARKLLFNKDSYAQNLIEQGSSKDIFYLTRNLNAENIISEHLPENLLSFLELHDGLEKNIKPHDRRVLEKETFLPVQSAEENEEIYTSVAGYSKWLWILMALLLLLERALARYKKQ